MSAGMETRGFVVIGRGSSTCALSTPWTVAESMPEARASANASSRFGPTCALVPAWASWWQVPHFWMKSTRPRVVSGLLVPQPAAISASSAPRARTETARSGFSDLDIGREAGGILYVAAPVPGASRLGRWIGLRLSARCRKTGHQRLGHAGERRYVGGDPLGRDGAHAARFGADDGREEDGRRARDRRRATGSADHHGAGRPALGRQRGGPRYRARPRPPARQRARR